MDYLYIVVKLIAGMIGLVVVTRFLGKKEMSQVTPLDFVYALVLGGIVEEGLYDAATGLDEIFTALAVWMILIYIFEKIMQKFDKLRHVVKGSPALIIEDGKLNVKEMKKHKLETEQVRELLRLHGVFSIAQVSYAVLENSGQLSVLENAREEPLSRKEYKDNFPENKLTYLLVEDGKIDNRALKLAEKDEAWLKRQLKEHNYSLETLQFAEWNPINGFHVQLKDS